MPAYDNKVLTGAGIAKLSQLIKEEIAQGGGSSGGTEYTAGDGIGIDNGVISTTNDSNKSIIAEDGKNVAMRYDGSSYHQLIGLNCGSSGINYISVSTFLSRLKESRYQLSGAPEFDMKFLKITDSTLSNILQIKEDGTQKFITLTTYASNPAEWYTWINARWIYINLGVNGRGIVWAQNMNALKAWLSRRCLVSSSALTATNVYAAVDELATTRVPSALVSTDTAPTTENAINWVYS